MLLLPYISELIVTFNKKNIGKLRAKKEGKTLCTLGQFKMFLLFALARNSAFLGQPLLLNTWEFADYFFNLTVSNWGTAWNYLLLPSLNSRLNLICYEVLIGIFQNTVQSLERKKFCFSFLSTAKYCLHYVRVSF